MKNYITVSLSRISEQGSYVELQEAVQVLPSAGSSKRQGLSSVRESESFGD
jgi:hypothetical protein